MTRATDPVPATATTYTVAAVPPTEARADLQRIWAANLTLETDAGRKFRWLYQEAPLPPAKVYLLRAGDAVVGTAGVGRRAFVVDGASVEAGLLADLAVDRAHRSVAPALALVRGVRADVLSAQGFAYGFPNKLAEGVFKRAGYRRLGVMTRFAKVVRHEGYLARLTPTHLARVPARLHTPLLRALAVPRLAQLAGQALDLQRQAVAAPTWLAARRQFGLTWTLVPDDRLDAIWHLHGAAYPVVAARTTRFLRWRFPGCEFVIAHARADGQPVAYAVIERQGALAIVRDLFGAQAALGPLLDLLAPQLARAGSSSISLRCFAGPWLVRQLEARGFVARDAERMIAFADGEAPPAMRTRLAEANAWYLTDADEDA